VAGRHACLEGEVELAAPAPLTPVAQQRPDPARTLTSVIAATIAPAAGHGTYLAGNRRRDPLLGPWRPTTDPEEHEMTEVTTVVDGYIAMWNETDPERRRWIIEQTWTDDSTYVDPHAEVDGATGVDFATVADDGRLRAATGFLEAA
jgi:hypothetical protein